MATDKSKEIAVQCEVIGSDVDISRAKALNGVRSVGLELAKATHKLLLEQAEVFFSAEALPSAIKNAPQVYMMLKAGQERGLSEVESLNSFYFVNGKLSMYGPAVISQVIKAGHLIKWGECNAKTATVKITRGDQPESFFEDTLTYEEAKLAGGTSDVWKKHTRNMLKYRIFRMVASFIVPDALQGISIESDTAFVIDVEGKTIRAGDPEYVELTSKDIAEFCRRLKQDEGYSDVEVRTAIKGALDRDKLGKLTQDEAVQVEKKLIENRDKAAAAQEGTGDQEGFEYDEDK